MHAGQLPTLTGRNIEHVVLGYSSSHSSVWRITSSLKKLDDKLCSSLLPFPSPTARFGPLIFGDVCSQVQNTVWHKEQALCEALAGESLTLSGEFAVDSVEGLIAAYNKDKELSPPRLQW